MTINSRKEAFKLGNISYHGKIHLKCGTTEKYTSHGDCVFCGKQKSITRNPEIDRKYRKSEKGRISVRKSNLKQKYGLSWDEYQKLLNQYQYKCGNKNCLNTKKLCVDHDHQTGKIKGILCYSCNLAAGILNEDAKIINGLSKYLDGVA